MVAKKFAGSDRRGAERRPILETFSLFLTVRQRGDHRLSVHDLSELGISFNLDYAGEEHSHFPVEQGQKLDIHFYLNQSLYLDLEVKVARIRPGDGVRIIGAEFVDQKSTSYQALMSFIKTLDVLLKAAKIKVG